MSPFDLTSPIDFMNLSKGSKKEYGIIQCLNHFTFGTGLRQSNRVQAAVSFRLKRSEEQKRTQETV